jgi:hypothetical protein
MKSCRTFLCLGIAGVFLLLSAASAQTTKTVDQFPQFVGISTATDPFFTKHAGLTSQATPAQFLIPALFNPGTTAQATFGGTIQYVFPHGASLAGLTLTGITGSTQCLEANTSGVVSGVACGVPTSNSVTNSLLAQMPASTIKGNNTVSTANAADLTVAQAMMLINGGPTKPTGRLTLTSGSPVMTSDVVNASSIFYTPYQGALVPIFDGTNWRMWPFSEQTLTLNASHITAGSVYDVYDSIQSGAPTICSSPAWTSTTSRASTPIQMQNGIYVNTNAMTGSCWNGTTAFTVAALAGTYLGSLYCTTGATSPACVTMQFKPSAVSLGSNNVLGLYNAYNRAPTFSIERDADLGWNTTTASTWEKAANSSNNRVTFLDPLQQSKITSTVANTYLDSSAASTFFIGQLLDSASGTPNLFARQTTSQAGFALAPAVTENFPPLLGIHFIQSMELSDVSGAATLWNAVAGEYALTISLEM